MPYCASEVSAYGRNHDQTLPLAIEGYRLPVSGVTEWQMLFCSEHI